MPLFVITGQDVADSASLRQSTQPAHVARLVALQEQGRLIIAGPTPIKHPTVTPDIDITPNLPIQMSGSIIIADFADLSAAQIWAGADPYIQAGVYSYVDIKPFIQALPAPSATITTQ